MNTRPSTSDESTVSSMVGNPLLAQIHDFIETDSDEVSIDPIGLVRRAVRGRLKQILSVTVLVAVLVSILGYLMVKPAYLSSGMVRVLPREAKILYTDSDDSRLRLYDAIVTAETQLLQSRPILETALKELKKNTMRKFPLPSDVGKMAAILEIKGKKGLITISARSNNPNLSAATVNAVLNAYMASNEAARSRHYDVLHDELVLREKTLERDLLLLNREYLEVGEEHDAGTLAKAHVTKTAQLEVIGERIVKLDNTIAQLQATGAVGADVANVEIQRATLLDQAMANMTFARAQLLAKLETLRGRYRENHHKVRAAVGELAVLEVAIAERLQQIAKLGKAGALVGGASGAGEDSKDELLMLRSELKARQENTRKEASDLNSKLIRIRGIVLEKHRIEELLAETKRALDEVMVESQNDLSRAVEIVAEGKVPDSPVDDKRKPAALGGAVFGGLGALSLFIGTTLIAGRVRFSDDLPRDSHALLTNAIPDLANPTVDMLNHTPQIRNEFDLHPAIPHTEPLVMAIVGQSVSAGTTTICMAMAAHYSSCGRKVLLIDANVANSGLCNRYDIDSLPGIEKVLKKESDLADSVQKLPVSSGSIDLCSIAPVMPKKYPSQHERGIALDDLRAIYDAARDHHDVTIVDLGVLDTGTQSALGATLADRILLVARTGNSQKPLLQNIELLSRIAPNRYLLALNHASEDDPGVSKNV
ncbi:MAG: hypothetical protein HRT77_06960 [Halioglobus sp.]|nr:hypothetical protein [Halioglobus sp.]